MDMSIINQVPATEVEYLQLLFESFLFNIFFLALISFAVLIKAYHKLSYLWLSVKLMDISYLPLGNFVFALLLFTNDQGPNFNV